MPKRVDHEERRQQIADALLRVVARDGLEAVSLRHVASEAEVTAGMVQHYFPSKGDMVRFAMGVASERYERRITTRLTDLGEDPPPIEFLRVLLGGLIPVDPSEVADARVGLAFQAYAASHADAAELLAEGERVIVEHIAELLTAAGIDSTRAQAVAVALRATAEGLATATLSANLPSEVALAALDAHLAILERVTSSR